MPLMAAWTCLVEEVAAEETTKPHLLMQTSLVIINMIAYEDFIYKTFRIVD